MPIPPQAHLIRLQPTSTYHQVAVVMPTRRLVVYMATRRQEADILIRHPAHIIIQHQVEQHMEHLHTARQHMELPREPTRIRLRVVPTELLRMERHHTVPQATELLRMVHQLTQHQPMVLLRMGHLPKPTHIPPLGKFMEHRHPEIYLNLSGVIFLTNNSVFSAFTV